VTANSLTPLENSLNFHLIAHCWYLSP